MFYVQRQLLIPDEHHCTETPRYNDKIGSHAICRYIRVLSLYPGILLHNGGKRYTAKCRYIRVCHYMRGRYIRVSLYLLSIIDLIQLFVIPNKNNR